MAGVNGTRLVATTDAGEQISARALINATGSWSRPFWPWYPGRENFAGWQLHTHDYPGADRFAGKRVRRGLPPRSVVAVTGLPLTAPIRAAREADVLQRFPMFAAIDASGVSWPDAGRFNADVLFWCTGFRAALDHLTPLRLRGAGGGIAMDGTRTVADPRVHLVGYGPSASTIGANRAGRVAVREIRGMLGLADGPGCGSGRHSVVE